MVEAGLRPGFRIMTERALPVEVVGWFILGMAVYTVGSLGHLVIKTGRFPGLCAVAGGALPIEVIGGLISGMAACAVGSPGNGMVEMNILP